MAYSAKVLDHYESPRNVGSFDKTDANIGTGMVGAPACGDVMKLQIKVENDIITDAVKHWMKHLLLRTQPSRMNCLYRQLKYIAQY